MIIRSKTISYLKVAYLLHLMTLLELALMIILFKLFQIEEWLMTGNLFLKILVLIPFAVAPFFPQFDAYSRFQNYKLIKDHLFIRGFQPRILKPFIQSRCQRDAAMVAAEELGMANKCSCHFYAHGYRWYHLLPDFLFTEPRILSSKAFWQNTFFAKKYTARFDYKKIADSYQEELNTVSLQQYATS